MADTKASGKDQRITDAIKFWGLVNDADSTNRAEALNDIKFAAGDQWPVEIQNSRNVEARPCLTINKIDSYIRQVTNQQRQQRPRIKVHPVNNLADYKIAQVIEGMTRHIEVNSNADTAYDTTATKLTLIQSNLAAPRCTTITATGLTHSATLAL